MDSTEPTPETAAPEAPTPAPSPSSLGGEIIAGIIGAVIAVGCAAPPIVHLVLGPLGPFLGGFVAGNRANPGVRGRIVIPLIIATGLSGLLGTAAAVFLSFADRSELPTWFPSSETLGAIVVVVWVYAAILSSVGIAVAVSLARKKSAAQ